MPATSGAQQKAAGAALAAKRGETSPDALHGAARQMYDSMTEAELEEMASVARKDQAPRRPARGPHGAFTGPSRGQGPRVGKFTLY